jgi:hypothetical protein
MHSSHQRRFGGAIKRPTKRHQSVTKLCQSVGIVEKALCNVGYSAKAQTLFKRFKHFGRSVRI